MRPRVVATTCAVVVVLATGCADVGRRDAASARSARATAPTARQTPQPPCRDTTPQTRGEAALRTLPDVWRAAGTTVSFGPAREGVLGETTVSTPPRVRVFVRPCAEESDELLRHVIAHELGHAWDRARMTPAKRDAYLRARRITTSTPWFGCSGCEDFATPAGDFAETYAQWLRGSRESRSELAPPATPDQLERLAAQFFR